MTSLLTNSSAMIALQTLSQIKQGLDTTSQHISTGLRINSAKDNAAYWSIATTTKSDNGALSAVSDSLGLGASITDVVSTGLSSAQDLLQQMKDALVAAVQPGVDRKKIQEQISGIQTDLKNKADSTSINEQNWLSVDSSVAGYNANKSFNASFTRAASGAVSIDTIDLNISSVALYDANGNQGIVDKTRTVGTGTAATTASVATMNISGLTDSTADLKTLNNYVSIVDQALQDTVSAENSVGITSSRISSQQTFVKALEDANTKAVGTLVDANMEEESTRLSALQTQQQLGVQSLSIANSSSQAILKLFQ